MTSTSATSSGLSLPVVLSTQTPYPLPSQKFMIPASWRRYQLSQLVNKALSLTQPVPFDFLVKGEILRTTLADWCAEKGVGEEETLEIEYIESVLPPQKMSDFPHDDWVSCVSCKLPGHFITSSYDGHIRSFDYSKNMTSNAHLHNAAITSICLLPSTPSPAEAQTITVATASHDLTGQLSQLTVSDITSSELTSNSKAHASAKPLATLNLHTAPLSSIATNASGLHLLTASWDSLIGLWDTTVPDSDEVPEDIPAEGGRRTKRRRVDGEKAFRKAPLAVLKSHTGRVTRAIFGTAGGGDSTAYSCGFDSTIRIWDTEIALCTRTISAAEKPFLSLITTESGLPSAVLALSTDRSMTLYDLSSSSYSASASFMHPATPSCVALGRGSGVSQQVVTGAYDGVVRVWDLRSTKSAVASFRAWDGGKKVLGVDWDTGVEGGKGVVGVAGEGGLEVWRVGWVDGDQENKA